MEILALVIFIAVSAYGIAWGLYGPQTRRIQMPFIMAIASIAYIVPQAIVIALNPRLVPEGSASGFYFWSSLCMIAAYYGYMKKYSHKRPSRIFSKNVTMHTCMVLMAGALSCFFFVFRISFTTEDVKMEVSGVFAMMYTGVKLSIPALTLACFSHYTGDKRLANKAIIFAGLIITLYFVLILGRRQWTFFLLYSTFFPALLLGRIRFKVSAMLAIVLLTPFLLISIPAYRDSFSKGFDAVKAEIENRPPSYIVREYASGMRQLELSQTILLFDVAYGKNIYGFGSGFWNGMIASYVPSTFMGKDFKESLMIKGEDYDSSVYDLHGLNYMNLSYTSKSGFGDSFSEFWIFGLFLYYYMGRVFRSASDNWFRRKDSTAGVFLCMFAFYPALLVYGQWAVFLPLAVPALIIYFLIALRMPKRKRTGRVTDGRMVNCLDRNARMLNEGGIVRFSRFST